jgi:hypothetical protein
MRKLLVVLIGTLCLTAYTTSFATNQALDQQAQAANAGTPAEICSANTPTLV